MEHMMSQSASQQNVQYEFQAQSLDFGKELLSGPNSNSRSPTITATNTNASVTPVSILSNGVSPMFTPITTTGDNTPIDLELSSPLMVSEENLPQGDRATNNRATSSSSSSAAGVCCSNIIVPRLLALDATSSASDHRWGAPHRILDSGKRKLLVGETDHTSRHPQHSTSGSRGGLSNHTSVISPSRMFGWATPLLSPRGTPMTKHLRNMKEYLQEIGHLTTIDPHDAWLPITQSRGGNAYYAAFHNLNASIGFQALLLPVAFTFLGWTWGILALFFAFGWFMYTKWLLVEMHECVPGKRISRFIDLAQTVFGETWGSILAMPLVLNLAVGTCIGLITMGGTSLELFFRTIVCPQAQPQEHQQHGHHHLQAGPGAEAAAAAAAAASLSASACGSNSNPLTPVEWYLIFTLFCVLLAHFPNLNSVAGVSLVGALMAVAYCTLVWSLSVSVPRPPSVSYKSVLSTSSSATSRVFLVLNALGLIAFAFRGHNLSLEIQATMPSTLKHPARVPMWKGALFAFAVTAFCYLPLSIGGYWAYGDKMLRSGILFSILAFHGTQISRALLGITFMFVVLESLCSFQIYAMPVFDLAEQAYTRRTNKKMNFYLRCLGRTIFVLITFFIAIAIPFLSSLAGLMGGLSIPLAFVLPSIMYIRLKKPEPRSTHWYINVGLGLVGVVLTIAVTAGGIWSIVQTGIQLEFFHPA